VGIKLKRIYKLTKQVRLSKNLDNLSSFIFVAKDIPKKLSGRNRSHRTRICTRAAIGTFVGVNRVNISCRDRFCRTFVDARTASNAVIRNFVSHNVIFKVYYFGQIYYL